MQLLLQKIQDHDDEQSFKEFYQLFFFRLYQFAYSYVHSKEVAEEVVNDVFLSLWQKRKTFDTINNINVYLYVAVKNASLNMVRKNKRVLTGFPHELEADHLHLVPNPELILISRELQLHIREAIEQLPPRCKIIFKLIKEEGLSYKEVACILDVSVKTVDTQLYLALKKLSGILKPLIATNSTVSTSYAPENG